MMRSCVRIAVLMSASVNAFGGIYVVPNISSAGNLAIPVGASASRFQEIVGSGQFVGPLVITGIHLRAAAGAGPVRFTYSSFSVMLSTTQAYPNTNNGHSLPSTTFASNVGPDAKVVYNAALSGSSPGCAGSGPCAFDLAIPFSSSFSFDPSKGRLLVDVVSSATTGTPAGSLDAISFTDSASSTAATVSGDPTMAAGQLNLQGVIFGLDTITPLISAVENSASNLAPGLPNGGIAQGSIFIVTGSGLGPATINIAPAAFQSATLSGTSAAVTVGGTTVNALMYYTSDGQIAALLASKTPVGAGTLTVSYNGLTSAAANMQVVANNLGIFTIDSSGQGPGIVTYGDYSLVSATKAGNCGGPNTACGAANPGDTLILWGTGLGPVNGDDASGAGLGQNMPNVPLTLWLGGVKITPIYQGRSGCCAGEDQVVFTVPNNLPTGCALPLVAQIGTVVSNTIAMPVAVGNRNCTPVAQYLSAVGPAMLAGSFTVGNIKLEHYSDGNGTFEDDESSQFIKIASVDPAVQPFLLSYVDSIPPGTCTVFNNLNENQNVPVSLAGLADPGATLTVKGPNGSTVLPANASGGTEFNSKGSFLTPGAYTVTGTGGADIGPFSAALTISALPTLVSPVNNSVAARANGLTATWTGGSGTLRIEVPSPTDSTNVTGSVVYCEVAASAGTFTIPAYAMLALPVTPSQTSAGFVLSSEATGTFAASGLASGNVSSLFNVAGFGYFWGSGSFTLR